MTSRLSLLFPYIKDKQMFYFSLLCIYTICSKSVLSSQHGCTTYNKVPLYCKEYHIFTKLFLDNNVYIFSLPNICYILH